MFAVALVLLSAVVLPSYQQQSGQYSWMPQGRFGKRTKDQAVSGSASAAGARQALWNGKSSLQLAVDEKKKRNIEKNLARFNVILAWQASESGGYSYLMGIVSLAELEFAPHIQYFSIFGHRQLHIYSVKRVGDHLRFGQDCYNLIDIYGMKFNGFITSDTEINNHAVVAWIITSFKNFIFKNSSLIVDFSVCMPSYCLILVGIISFLFNTFAKKMLSDRQRTNFCRLKFSFVVKTPESFDDISTVKPMLIATH
jgi:hypothetical protein